MLFGLRQLCSKSGSQERGSKRERPLSPRELTEARLADHRRSRFTQYLTRLEKDGISPFGAAPSESCMSASPAWRRS